MTSMTRLPSQEIGFDPSVWVGLSAEQIELVRKGFMAGLDLAYAAEKKAVETEQEQRERVRDGELDALCAEEEDAGWTQTDEESMRFVSDTPRFNEAGEWLP